MSGNRRNQTGPGEDKVPVSTPDIQEIIEQAKKAAKEIAVETATATAEKVAFATAEKTATTTAKEVASAAAEKSVQQAIGNAVAEAARNNAHPEQEKKSDQPLVKVSITKSPFGKFKLPYYVGQEKELPKPLADELIKAQYAVKV